MRTVVAISVSLIVAFALVMAVEGFSAVVHPFPEGVDPTDLEVCKTHVANYPSWILAVVVPMWGGITFVSVWLATRLGARRHPAHGIAIGLFLIVSAAFNMYMLPYPLWFELGNLLALPLGMVCGVNLGRGRTSRQRNADPDTAPTP